MNLICRFCYKPLTSTVSQRRGAHAQCLIDVPLGRQAGQLRLMVYTYPRPPQTQRRVRQEMSGKLGYLLQMAQQGRGYRTSIIGRCWIESSRHPATTRPLTAW